MHALRSIAIVVFEINSRAIEYIYTEIACQKIGTLGVHVSAQRNSMVAMKKIHSQLLSKHLNFEVTIQPAASYLVNCLKQNTTRPRLRFTFRTQCPYRIL